MEQFNAVVEVDWVISREGRVLGARRIRCKRRCRRLRALRRRYYFATTIVLASANSRDSVKGKYRKERTIFAICQYVSINTGVK